MNKVLLILVVVFVLMIATMGIWWIQYKSPALSPSLLPLQSRIVAPYHDMIQVDSPTQGSSISSPVTITGKARGTWFFEASFPVVLVDWDGLIIAEGHAEARSDWMTQDYVPFEAQLTFKKPSYNNRGTLILKKDNPSGLPEYDDALEIPIFFQ
jgi:hypothetical protein